MEKTIRLIVQYDMEQEVYLKTDPYQYPMLVTGYKITPNTVIYYLTMGSSESAHYDFEISETKKQTV